MSSFFRITHPLITLEITLEEIGKLYIHEETIPNVLNKLSEKIKADGHFLHPIVVDRKTRVVLDGMHRVAAMQKIGCRFVPICLVDYDNQSIVVGSWYRPIDGLSDIADIFSILKELNLTVEEGSLETAYELVEKREAATAIVSQSKCFIIFGSEKNRKETCDIIRQIELELRSKGYAISYETEKRAKEMIYSYKAPAALITPIFSKKEIVEKALAGGVFPQKMTQHIIPARPMFINVPLELLYGKLSLSQANECLTKLLFSKKLKRLPPGQVMEREYEEELYIFT